jgi:predicted ATP-grasp superfamily ATP-dependent carboligase
MEINARHWMWHSLAAHSGVNLSLAAYRDAVGRPYIARRQTDGPRWSMAIDDATDAMGEIRRGDLSVWPWLASYKGVRVDGALSLDDPLPGLTIFSRKVVRKAAGTVIRHFRG